MTPILRDSSFALARSSARSLTLADLLALPAVTDLVTAGKALGIGRTTSYELARAGRFPCRIIRVGRNYRVPTAALLALLGASGAPPPDTASLGNCPTDKSQVPAETAPDIGPTPRGHDGNVVQVEAPAPAPDADSHGLMAAQWLEEWLTRARLRESTRRSYRGHLRNHLRPRLSGVSLTDLDVAALQQLFTAMVEDGVSEATVRRVYCTVRSALNVAVRERVLPDNPTRYLRIPAGRRPHAVIWTSRRVKNWRRTGKRPPVAVWTPAQTRRFLQSIAGHPLYTAFLLMALCGLRRGETCGLRWSDLDLDAGLAYINRQVQQVHGVLTAGPLKTPASRRAVILGPEIVDALRALGQTQTGYARANGIATSRYVIPGPGGGPMRPDYLTLTFGRLVKTTGLPPVRPHDLRHGAATLMMLQGTELKVIADQLGHSSVVLTADTYLSVAIELGLKSAAAAARLILSHAGRPPGGGTTRRPSAPPQAIIVSRAASPDTLVA
jgi:integrase